MPHAKKILVVNPNSNETVTRSLSEALQPFSRVSGFEVEIGLGEELVSGPVG